MKKLVAIILLLALSVTAFAACGGGEDTGLNEAGEYLYSLYKDNAEVTPSDYDVVGKVMVGTTAYTVEWSVDVAEGVTIKESSKASFFTIDVNEKTDKEIVYVLTATIKNADGDSITKTFTRKVPEYNVASYAEYAAAEDDAALVVEGIVIGIFSKSNGSSSNGLYLQDANNEGGYYVYGLTEDPSADLGIKVGMTVSATGVKDTYNGTYEIVNATVAIVDSTIQAVTPVDYTETFKNATALTDEALVGRQSMLVTIKGVEITGQDTSNGYYKFKLGDLETYVRISSSNNCISKDEIEAFKAGHSEHTAWSADVTGIVSLYSGALYLIPAGNNCFAYQSEIQKTDAEKIDIELGSVSVLGNAVENTVVNLPLAGTNYDEVTFAWSVSENTCATLDAATGALTITLPEAATELTLTLTATCGAETKTVTYTIKVDAATTDLYLPTFADTVEAGKAYKLALYQTNLGQNLYFTGVVTSAEYLELSDKADKAVDVYMETVEGGYRFYFMNGDAKTYIQIYKNAGGKIRLQAVTEPTAVFTYSEDAKTYVVEIDGKNYYMGTYKTYNTISASDVSYISGDKAADVGVSQFVAGLYNLTLKEVAPVAVETPVAGEAYKLTLFQTNLGQQLYFTGKVTSAEYLDLSDKLSKAVDVMVETVEGGYRFYFMDGDAKTYIQIYKNAGGKIRLQAVTEPTSVFTYNEDAKTFVTEIDGKNYYMGTYKTYNTISASDVSYISGDKAADVGVSQFVAYFATVEFVK